MAQVPEVQVQIQVKTRISGKFQELPEMRQLEHKRNFVQCKTGMQSSSVGKVFGHHWLSKWLKFLRTGKWKDLHPAVVQHDCPETKQLTEVMSL